MSVRVINVTERFKVISDFSESGHIVSCYFDDKKVLQAYKGFYFGSKPSWSVWGKYGYEHDISKDEYKRLYDKYAAL